MKEIEFVSVFFHQTSYETAYRFVASFNIHHDESDLQYEISYRTHPSGNFIPALVNYQKIGCFTVPQGIHSIAIRIVASDGLGDQTTYDTDFFQIYEDINHLAMQKESKIVNGVHEIENVSLFFHPSKYHENYDFSVGFFISNKQENLNYLVKARYSENSDFEEVLLGSSKFSIFYVKPGNFFLELSFTAIDVNNVETKQFLKGPFTLNVNKNFVKVWGYIVDNGMRPMGNNIITCRLSPNNQNFEFGSTVINPKAKFPFATDEFGYFEVVLPANKSSDQTTRIKQRNTFYEFEFSDQVFNKEIDYDNGPVQAFTSLLEPEHMRKRKEQLFGVRVLA